MNLPRSAPPWSMMGLLGLGCLVAILAHSMIGSTWIEPIELIQGWLGHGEAAEIVWPLRFPRVGYCVTVGAMLGLVGAAFQSLFRNPISDPYVVGVSSGAAVGGALALVMGIGVDWGTGWDGLGPVAMATVGGLGALTLVMALATRRGRLDTFSLLLVGVVTGSMLSSVLSLVLLMGGQDTNMVLRWLLGSMTPAYLNRLQPMAVVLGMGFGVLMFHARHLNALAFGDEAAARLGIHVGRTKATLLVTGSFMVALTVGVVGMVGFLGLVAPHLARRLVGVDWRWSLPASALAGSMLLTLSDLLAQRLIANAEIPVGVLTAILGAPALLVLMRQRPATTHN